MQGTDLETLLDSPAGEPQATPDTPAQAEAPPQAETGVDDSAAPPADAKPEDAPEQWTKQAVLDERRKRQELEKKLKDFEARFAAPPQPAKQPEPEAQPDWWGSPEQAAQALQQQMELKVFETRVAMSERLVKQEHADYDEVSSLFAERAKQDPRLIDELMKHPFPAEFAYSVGQQIKLMDEIGTDPAAYRARLKAELIAEIGGQQQQPPPQQARQASSPAVPRSLARDVSAQPRLPNGKFASLDQPASLDDIFG